MKKKSKIKKGKATLLGMAGIAFIASLVYDKLKSTNADQENSLQENNNQESFEEN